MDIDVFGAAIIHYKSQFISLQNLGDVILEVNGEKVTVDNSLQAIVQKHVPGDTLKLKVWRDGKTFEVNVTLDERKNT
jgi:S1-C subfamily serine protease